MIIVNFIGLVLDIVTYFILEYFSFYYLSLLFCKLILFFLLCWISLLTFYILYISYGNSDNYNKYNKFIKLIFIISSLLVFVLPLKVVYVDNHFYSVGVATQYLYFVSFAYIFLWIIMLTKNIKNIFNKKYYPIFAYMNIGIIVIIIQYNFPWLLLMVPMETFVTYLLYFTIENPDMKLLEEVHKSKEISDAANEEKTLFLYNMTQEIRNTTSEIDDNANIILDSDSIDTDKDCARERKGITSKFMTNEMFDVSKLDSASIKVYNSKYNIKNILKEIVTMYSKICKDKNIDFTVNIDRDVPEVLYGDSINVKEVLSIIMDNSVKYTKEGFIEFNVSTIIKNDVCRLIMTIEDSGVGIKSDDIDKIKIGDKSLSKANKLVTLMNGALMVSSNYGMGTKVKVILDQKIELQVNEDVAKYSEIYDLVYLDVETEYIYIPEEREEEKYREEEYEEEPPSVIDINTASAEDFAKLPGVDISLGQRIVDLRREIGGFKNKLELLYTEGMTDNLFVSIQEFLVCESAYFE